MEPGWRDSVDPGRINIADGCNCVCGQVFADRAGDEVPGYSLYASNGFTYGLYQVAKDRSGYDNPNQWAVAHGFLVLTTPLVESEDGDLIDNELYERELADLKDAWARIIHSAPAREAAEPLHV